MRIIHVDDNMTTFELSPGEPLVVGPQTVQISPQRCYVKPDGAFTNSVQFAPSLIFECEVGGATVIMQISAKTLLPAIGLMAKMAPPPE